MALKIALVGCGEMGAALLKGWLTLPDSGERFEKIWVVAPHREKVEPFLKDSRVQWLSSPEDLLSTPDLVLFAVKPVILGDVLKGYTPFKCLFISVATGKSLDFYRRVLPQASSVVRAMPNMPVEIHQGVIGLLSPGQLTASQQFLVETCLGPLGYCLWVESDDDLDKLTAISGSGPAYVFAMIEAMAKSAEALGFEKPTALSLALATFLGASASASQSKDPPSDLRERVTSPQGTTAAALKVFAKADLSGIIERAVKAAYGRAKELGK